jgi:NCAIR mutase (PurE)-related protein
MSDPVRSPFDDLRAALDATAGALDDTSEGLSPRVRADIGRLRRTGIPEVVHAERKRAVDVAAALRGLAEANGRALASRVPAGEAEAIRLLLEPDLAVEEQPRAKALVVSVPGRERPRGGGVVGVVSAGTSDIPIAAEAALMAAEMGAAVHEAWDAGVAGLHRLVEPLERFAAAGVDVIIVAAGMDGALPSVVAGLVDVPVIGLPTSIGYGFGGGGVGAMTTMLQSCAPGLVVVNIDNGIGAGSTAALIANRAGALRGGR